jgi:sulfite reductase (ferredoxin)
LEDPLRDETQNYARRLARRFKPASRAYYEIWLDGEKAAAAESAANEEEPVFGSAYLPRKFKIGFAAPGDNCIDVYTNDAGVVPVYGPGGLQGFTILAGGGLGTSPGVKATHPRLADPICTVAPDQLGDVVEAMITIHRDFGSRANRKLARLKYVIEAWGLDRFKAELARRLGRPLEPPEPLAWLNGGDHLGWHAMAGGLWFLGIPVSSGRIKDGAVTLRSALREVVSRFDAGVRLTPQQNILLTGIPAAGRAEVENTLEAYGVPLLGRLPPVVSYSMACPGLPTCSQAITEAERVLPAVLEDIRHALGETGLAPDAITVRLTGCPNGCARPLTAEIGLVGQSVNLYGIHVGGSPLGTRLASLYAVNVPRGEIANRLRPLFRLFREQRQPGERFGDFCHRIDAKVEGQGATTIPCYSGWRASDASSSERRTS